jgi:uncharacterized protein
LGKYPSSFSLWANCVMGEVFGAVEVAVVGERAHEKAKAINAEYLPQKVLMAAKEGEGAFPLLKGKQGGDYTLVYLCQNYACQQPVETIEEFRQIMGQVKRH